MSIAWHRGGRMKQGFLAYAGLGAVQVEVENVLVCRCSTTAGWRGTKMACEQCLQSVEGRNGF